jgi:GntR family transcriptional regulator
MTRMPLYKAAEAEMLRRIEAGEWEVGRRLPNEFVLAEEFRVSQGTMRRALMTLEGLGLLSRKPGRGTVVARAGAAGPSTHAAGPAGLILADGRPAVFAVHRARSGLRRPEAEEADLFGGGGVASLRRVLKLGGTRAGLEETVFPQDLAPVLDEEAPADLDACIAAHGLDHTRITDEVGAAVTSLEASVTLACDRHAPLLVVTRTARDTGGRAVARQVLRLLAEGVTYA